MTKTVTFIAPKRLEETTNGVTTITHTRYDTDELIDLLRTNDPGLIAATEAHAQQVLRPQGNYQEVPEQVLDQAQALDDEQEALRVAAASVSNKQGQRKYASKSEEKRVRTQRMARNTSPDGSNDVPHT